MLVTCSSIGPAVDAARTSSPCRCCGWTSRWRTRRRGWETGRRDRDALDDARADGGARRAARAAAGRDVVVDSRVCDGAFEALQAGRREGHDELVRECLRGLVADVDVIVLAQASMARVVDTLPEEERRCRSFRARASASAGGRAAQVAGHGRAGSPGLSSRVSRSFTVLLPRSSSGKSPARRSSPT